MRYATLVLFSVARRRFVLAWVVAACGQQAVSSPTQDAGPDVTDAGAPLDGTPDVAVTDGGAATCPYAPGCLGWILDDNFMPALLATDAAGLESLAQGYFDTNDTFVSHVPSGFPKITPMLHLDTTDFGSVFSSCSSVPQATGAVLWGPDPAQVDDGGTTFMANFVALHSAVQAFNAMCRPTNPLLIIGTLAADLGEDADAGGDNTAKFIAAQYALDFAPYVDILQIQSQASESDQTEFVSFLTQAGKQAKTGNPAVRLMGGLATIPSRLPSCDPHVLLDDIAASPSDYEGYWLNYTGAECGDSGRSEAEIAAQLLELLSDAIDGGVSLDGGP